MSWEDRELKRNYKDEPVPQHWGGNDWEVTGVDHPLPVANYTQNDNGLWIPVSKDNPMPTQVTGSNAEEVYKETDILIPAQSVKVLAYIDISEYKEFFVHFIPNGLSHYHLRYYIRRESGAALTRKTIEIRDNASNGATDRFEINALSSALSIENNTDNDHIFGEIYLFGVRR